MIEKAVDKFHLWVYYETVLIVIVQLTHKEESDLITIDYKSRVPIYDQITGNIMRLKSLGILKAGDKLPSVRSLALKLGINPNTVQKAYNILEADGVICSVSGKGSFIAEGDRATEALINAAKDEFKMAAESALRTGLSRETLEEILDTIYKGGKTDD